MRNLGRQLHLCLGSDPVGSARLEAAMYPLFTGLLSELPDHFAQAQGNSAGAEVRKHRQRPSSIHLLVFMKTKLFQTLLTFAEVLLAQGNLNTVKGCPGKEKGVALWDDL